MQSSGERGNLPASVWLLILSCAVAVVFALCSGAAWSGVRQARHTAARAGVGQIEAVFLLAEKTADQAGLGPAPAAYANLLKSYDDAGSAILPAYEKYVLDCMLQAFGTARDFDFAINRYEDGAGTHIEVYYFPAKGRTDQRIDHHYLYSGGVIVEKNG